MISVVFKNWVFHILVCVILVTSCNKEKLYSKRFCGKSDSSEWSVSFFLEDSLYSEDISLRIFKCDIYQDLCEGTAFSIDETEGESDFYWQFQDKGKTVVFHRKSDNDSSEIMDDWIFSISGEYDVLKAKKKEMIFESYSTLGFEGQKVQMLLYKAD